MKIVVSRSNDLLGGTSRQVQRMRRQRTSGGHVSESTQMSLRATGKRDGAKMVAPVGRSGCSGIRLRCQHQATLLTSAVQFVAHPRERSLSRITSVCWSGRHLVEADRTDARSYCQTEDGRYPLPGYPRQGHPLLSVIPGLLRSFEPPITSVAYILAAASKVLLPE
jgi:hypothetical protein